MAQIFRTVVANCSAMCPRSLVIVSMRQRDRIFFLMSVPWCTTPPCAARVPVCLFLCYPKAPPYACHCVPVPLSPIPVALLPRLLVFPAPSRPRVLSWSCPLAPTSPPSRSRQSHPSTLSRIYFSAFHAAPIPTPVSLCPRSHDYVRHASGHSWCRNAAGSLVYHQPS